MPRGNGLGPAGYGPMTGRGMGFCAGSDMPGYMNSGAFGAFRGRRHPYGYGRGMGRGFAVWPDFVSREDEVQGLKSQAEFLKGRLQEVEQRLQGLESQNESE